MHTVQHAPRIDKREKESIHSGQFMVSHFEAEEQDDEDNVAVPIPEVTEDIKSVVPVKKYLESIDHVRSKYNHQELAIDNSLSKLFQCMSLAYRQKLTSPKWNRFRGIRLRWKDKIRLNNVIWRCWHLQFIRKKNTLICQFASPLDVDTHNKPEAVVLEGKYWKRKLAAVTAEYKKWRMFYRNHALGHAAKDNMEMLSDVELLVWDSTGSDKMMVDEDYMGLMSDTLFTTIASQPFVFPDSREIARAGLADFIQPSLGPLQPNLDDYMDTMDPFQDFINNVRLPPVPEEQTDPANHWGYIENDVQEPVSQPQIVQYQQLQPIQPMHVVKGNVPYLDTSQSNYGEIIMPQTQVEQYTTTPDPPPYHSTVISKIQTKVTKNAPNVKIKMYNKPVDLIFQQSSTHNMIQQPLMINNQVPNQNIMPLTDPQQQIKLTTQPLDQQPFKMPPNSQDNRLQQNNTTAYKFPSPGSTQPNVKFTSQQVPTSHVQYSSGRGFLPHVHYQPATSPNSSLNHADKPEPRRRGAPRGRQRSRSNTREPIKRPPLISAMSDPQLITPGNSLLLTQLLTSSNFDSKSISHEFSRSQSTESVHDVRLKEEKSPIAIAQPVSTTPISYNACSNSNSPTMDMISQNLNSPTSSQGSIGSPNRDSQKDRRAGHIHAEQKRRYNIKNGFDMIHSLIPHLKHNPNTKLSKAAMLQKGAEYIRQLRSERNQLIEEMDSLRQQIESLNTSISNCQSMLPATGAPVSRRRDSRMQEMFEEHVRTRTNENWKYWIFSLIFRPLLNTFNNIVSTSSLDDLYSSTMMWVEQHCTLVDLRPIVLNSLTNMCTITDVLTDPEKLPEEARQMVQRRPPNNQ